ncbi:hypothetical protein [Massilia genomosp. 1]|uniref:hypothetical protein n=1 Tax=Massilia genomosp. 1 TaxID=2609280 RepID=UPI001420E340|nr:hypothetical protein [Massilia genomosp. 1]
MYIVQSLRVRTLLPLTLLCALALPAAADDFVTKTEAEAMVKKTVAYLTSSPS